MWKNNSILKIIAGLQIVGGAIGIIYTWIRLTEAPAIVVYFTVFAFISGILLWKNNRWGYITSIFNQLLQIVTVSSQFFTYKFVTGFGLLAFIDTLNKHVNFVNSWGTYMHFATNSEMQVSSFDLASSNIETGSSIGINLIAILFTIYLIIKFIHYLRTNQKNYKKILLKRVSSVMAS